MANLRNGRLKPLSKPLPVTGFPVLLSLYGPTGLARRQQTGSAHAARHRLATQIPPRLLAPPPNYR